MLSVFSALPDSGDSALLCDSSACRCLADLVLLFCSALNASTTKHRVAVQPVLLGSNMKYTGSHLLQDPFALNVNSSGISIPKHVPVVWCVETAAGKWYCAQVWRVRLQAMQL